MYTLAVNGKSTGHLATIDRSNAYLQCTSTVGTYMSLGKCPSAVQSWTKHKPMGRTRVDLTQDLLRANDND